MSNSKPWDAQLAYYLIYPLRQTRVNPNHLTTLRLLFGLASALLFSLGNAALVHLAAFCFVISNFLDHADGELARLTGKMSKAGHIYDLVCDALINILLFIGIGVGLRLGTLGLWSIPMGIIAGFSVAGIFHMRHIIEQQVGKAEARQPHFAGFEAEDVLYLLPLITFFDVLTPFLILASVGAPAYAIIVLLEFKHLGN